MAELTPKAYLNYRWIVADPDWLGGKPMIRGTRLSVSLILECLGAGMNLKDINDAFGGGVSNEALTEALAVGSDLADRPCVAA